MACTCPDRQPLKALSGASGGINKSVELSDRFDAFVFLFTLESVFIDRVKIRIKAGDGGDGVTAFRREKFVPRGGPSGGDGGGGGSVYMESDEGLNTLLHLRYNPEHKADRGRHGEGSNRHGKDGEEASVRVPMGTQVFDVESGDLLFDFTEAGQRFLAAKGGKGGWGNAHFATSTRQAPKFHYTGRPGQEKE